MGSHRLAVLFGEWLGDLPRNYGHGPEWASAAGRHCTPLIVSFCWARSGTLGGTIRERRLPILPSGQLAYLLEERQVGVRICGMSGRDGSRCLVFLTRSCKPDLIAIARA